MIVSIDPNKPGELVLSREAYDHKVAGIVSGANGTFNIRGPGSILTLTGNNTYSGSWELLEPVVRRALG